MVTRLLIDNNAGAMNTEKLGFRRSQKKGDGGVCKRERRDGGKRMGRVG